MATFTIDSQPIHASDEGGPHKPMLLLIHGWMSSWYCWVPLLPALSARYRCIAVDLPGFGASPALPQPPTIARYAELMAGLIDQQSNAPVTILGHSMGGLIGATVALRYPDLVERLVLVCPALSGRLSWFMDKVVAPQVLIQDFPPIDWLLTRLSRASVMNNYLNRLIRTPSLAERSRVPPEALKRISADLARPGGGKTRAACYGAMRAGGLSGQLGHIRQEALVLWGAEDNVVPLRDASMVAAEWPRADLRILPGASHWPQFERPDAVLDHIARFLGLPQLTGVNDGLVITVDAETLEDHASFLANTELARTLTTPQRQRLAGQLLTRTYQPGAIVFEIDARGDELVIVRQGSMSIWVHPESVHSRAPGASRDNLVQIATLGAGQTAGELALLDGSPRSARLVAGPEGATVLVLKESRFKALCVDDPETGLRLMENLAVALAQRIRTQNFRAARGTLAEQKGTGSASVRAA